MSFKQLKTNPHRSECSVCKDKPFVLCQCETPQTKLSDEEINKLYEESYLSISKQEWEFDPVYFARAIEAKVRGDK